MKTWKTYIQLNGDGESKFIVNEFEISKELYNQIQEATEKDIPLKEAPCYEELSRLAHESYSIEKYLPFEDYEEPKRDEFDSQEEYDEAVEEYNFEKEKFYDAWCEEDFTIFDPLEEKHLKDTFVGEKIPDEDGDGEMCYEWDNDEDWSRISQARITVCYQNGIITDIVDIYEEALEWEGERSSSWGECLPNYSFIEDKLKDELENE